MGLATGAIIASTVVGLAGTVYTQEQQKSAQNKARKAQDKAENEARINEKKIRDASAEVKTASFGFGDGDDDEIGSYDDFLAPTQAQVGTAKTGLNAGGSSTGLGV
ncbi:MAG: hypothetical protein DRH37_07320 [Deltaproteobacteria bacterium]|nr:MAG: hypothetical protein DRH37_07320 [Deltaproteobacteria bacterium]